MRDPRGRPRPCTPRGDRPGAPHLQRRLLRRRPQLRIGVAHGRGRADRRGWGCFRRRLCSARRPLRRGRRPLAVSALGGRGLRWGSVRGGPAVSCRPVGITTAAASNVGGPCHVVPTRLSGPGRWGTAFPPSGPPPHLGGGGWGEGGQGSSGFHPQTRGGVETGQPLPHELFRRPGRAATRVPRPLRAFLPATCGEGARAAAGPRGRARLLVSPAGVSAAAAVGIGAVSSAIPRSDRSYTCTGLCVALCVALSRRPSTEQRRQTCRKREGAAGRSGRVRAGLPDCPPPPPQRTLGGLAAAARGPDGRPGEGVSGPREGEAKFFSAWTLRSGRPSSPRPRKPRSSTSGAPQAHPTSRRRATPAAPPRPVQPTPPSIPSIQKGMSPHLALLAPSSLPRPPPPDLTAPRAPRRHAATRSWMRCRPPSSSR